MPNAATATALAVNWVELGLVPDSVIRLGIRRLLKQRMQEVNAHDPAAEQAMTQAFFEQLSAAPLALVPEKANAQHYEVPSAFFADVLGPHRKYSCCWWPDDASSLEEAEAAALQLTCERAGLANGQRILELGCGWGSLSLWMAEHYPGSQILAVSNSRTQRETILALAHQRGLTNLDVQTHDFNNFQTGERFDRVVSVEMFEHLRNWPRAFAKVESWLRPEGRFFMHVFTHRGAAYPFEVRDESDWMSEHFFSGGMMPSDDLALRCQDDLRVLQHWRWSGEHYQKTSEAWLARMDSQREKLMPLFEATYGGDALIWWQRWRLFFMSVAELFGYEQGQRWQVSHYLFAPRS